MRQAEGEGIDMATVLILGAGGRLGAALAREYAQTHNVLAWGRGEADLSHPEQVAGQILKAKPDVVINCAAMTNVDQCETERELALTVNSEAPGAIAVAAGQLGARMIHVSTDYVFSGEKTSPYSEDDEPDPISWYGQTKLKGEQGVLASGQQHAVTRVSWVFGPDRDSFIDKALQTAMRGEPVKAVADKWSSPAYTIDIAEALSALIKPEVPGGIYHVCNSGVCTWLDWASAALSAAEQAGVLTPGTKPQPLRLADISAMVAKRPVHSSMSCRRIEQLAGRPMRAWQLAVEDYVQHRYGVK